MKKHINIPIFIPHYGCPNACIFCNQVRITGKKCFNEAEVISEIDNALSTVNPKITETELAFFGGSFTAIPRDEMLSLLAISDRYINSGRISSVRLSTRPDAIDNEILDILKAHSVKTIELGIQSTSEKVLEACKRGHTPTDAEKACLLIKQYGFELVGQMMIGLPFSTAEAEEETARNIIKWGADATRIYPTVVLPATRLAEMENLGEYTALTINEAADRSARILEIFEDNKVKVIRIGLCSTEILTTDASPSSYHAAVGELTRNLVFRKKMEMLLLEYNIEIINKNAVFYVPKGKISQAIGQKRSNVNYLIDKFRLNSVKAVESDALDGFEIKLTLT